MLCGEATVQYPLNTLWKIDQKCHPLKIKKLSPPERLMKGNVSPLKDYKTASSKNFIKREVSPPGNCLKIEASPSKIHCVSNAQKYFGVGEGGSLIILGDKFAVEHTVPLTLYTHNIFALPLGRHGQGQDFQGGPKFFFFLEPLN